MDRRIADLQDLARIMLDSELNALEKLSRDEGRLRREQSDLRMELQVVSAAVIDEGQKDLSVFAACAEARRKYIEDRIGGTNMQLARIRADREKYLAKAKNCQARHDILGKIRERTLEERRLKERRKYY